MKIRGELIGKKKSLILSMGLTILFTKIPLINITLKLKIGIVSFQNTCFKYLKLKIVIQTLFIKKLLPKIVFFLRSIIFNFKH